MGLLPARPARPRVRQVERPDVAGADRHGGRDGDGAADLRRGRRRRSPASTARVLAERRRRRRAHTRSKRPADRRVRRDARRDTRARDARPRSRRCATRSPSSSATATRSRSRGSPTSSRFAAGHEIIRQRQARPDPRPADAGPHLRPDDRGRRRPQAGLLVARQPGRRRARRDPAADRGRASRPSRSRSRSTATSGWSGGTRRAR